MDLQREIQAQIGTQKRLPKETRVIELNELRSLLFLARRLGDALAWIVLDFDRGTIQTLCRAPRVPVAPSEEPGHRGVKLIAPVLSDRGWGFPVLHDLTLSLRIGDVTFIRYKPEGHELTTTEIKTRVTHTEPIDKQTVRRTYNIQAIVPLVGDLPEPLEAVTSIPFPAEDSGSASAARRSQRTQRQIGRLADALLVRSAPRGRVVASASGGYSVGIEVSLNAHDGDLFRRLTRRARRQGIAVESIDDTFIYAAYYSADGFQEQQMEPLLDAIATLDFLHPGADFTAICMFTLPEDPGQYSAFAMPFYLLGLPKTTINDMLAGRMLIMCAMNPAGVVKGLRRAGLTVVPPSPKQKWFEMEVGSHSQDADGTQRSTVLKHLHQHVLEALYEARGVNHVVEIALAMAKAGASWRPDAEAGFGDVPSAVPRA